MKLKYEFEISQEALNLLISIEDENYLEYKYPLPTNSNHKYAMELYKRGFIQREDEAWHETYVISELGKEILKQNNL